MDTQNISRPHEPFKGETPITTTDNNTNDDERDEETLKEETVRISVYHAAQDDPKKNTALRLNRRGYVRIVKKIRFLPKRAIVLNPFSDIAFSPADHERLENFGLAALDCSWEQAQKVLGEHVRGTSRCLPILLASNPVNFGKLTKLSTAEALSAALYIAGFKETAEQMLSIFTWGHTFFELNQTFLDKYTTAKNSEDIIKIQKTLFENNQNKNKQ